MPSLITLQRVLLEFYEYGRELYFHLGSEQSCNGEGIVSIAAMSIAAMAKASDHSCNGEGK